MAETLKTYAITGIKAGVVDNKVPLRLEVDTWYPGQTPEHLLQNSLFLWALRFFQDRDPDAKLSYFQVAGIHGLPYMPWDEDTDAQTMNEGYCTHDSLLFPTWHRPYVLLYEQLLYEIMINEVIPKFPQGEQQKWLDAASTFRLPYWDWAEKKQRSPDHPPIYDVPIITKSPKIKVVDLSNTASTVDIDNPMYKFTMPDNERMGCAGISDVQDTTTAGKIVTIPFSKSRGTSRWAPYEPESTTVSPQWEAGEVDNEKIAKALQKHPWYGRVDNIPLAEMVYRLFLHDYIKTFTQFATTKHAPESKTTPESYLSLEYIHNNIHNWTGGFDNYMGHMAEIPAAGFDPIFWLHHCNVDRQFALWQALNVNNSKNWFQRLDEQLKDDGTWSIKKDNVDTPTTPLAPFHKDTHGTYFTPDDVRDWFQWHYSYPELQPWLKKYQRDGHFDERLYIDDIKWQLKELYSPAEIEHYQEDYIINVEYKRFALNGIPYTIYFFIGPESDLDEYQGPLHKHPNHVGFVYTFSNPVYRNRAAPGCENCRRKAAEGTSSRAQVPITGALIAHVRKLTEESNPGMGDVPPGLGPDFMGAWLQENLHWRVGTHGYPGALLPQGHNLEGAPPNSRLLTIPQYKDYIQVSVYHRSGRFDDITGDEHYQPLRGVTHGKPGGIGL
ncbi:Tyrosinase [Orbilia brochopaga]|nr:Tyrosinase [Drechslerella brochopaga]